MIALQFDPFWTEDVAATSVKQGYWQAGCLLVQLVVEVKLMWTEGSFDNSAISFASDLEATEQKNIFSQTKNQQKTFP